MLDLGNDGRNRFVIGEYLNGQPAPYSSIPEYNYRGGQHLLIISVKDVRQSEIDAVQRGTAHFAVKTYHQCELIFFLFKFDGGFNWSDCAFTIWKVPPAERILPEMPQSENERALLKVLLVEARTGEIKAIRVLTLSPEVTRFLHEAIIEQAKKPMPDDYRAKVDAIFSSSSSDAIAESADVSCRGGE